MFTFAFIKNNGEIIQPPSASDLVSLGILSKPISEFTNDDIGTIVSIPYTDASGKIDLNNGCIEFEVVGVNHHKSAEDESKPTITLMSKNILRFAVFDEAEIDNPDSNRKDMGNNRWSVSNIRQWLNSNGAANEWFTPQHQYDTAPNAYAANPGFLTGFNDEIKPHFATVRNTTILCNADKTALSKDFEETEDKVFLPSYTEIGFGNRDDNNPEGSHLAQRFTDDESRCKYQYNFYEYAEWYWLRTPDASDTHKPIGVDQFGAKDFSSYVIANRVGIRCLSFYSSLLIYKIININN